jgi:hypothetical protein
MARGDVAKINIVTNAHKLIDASITVLVLGVSFKIRVIEAVGGLWEEEVRCCHGCAKAPDDRSCRGSGDGGSVEGLVDDRSEDENDSDWSVSREEVLDVGVQDGRKGEESTLRLEANQELVVSGCDPTLLGNPLGIEPSRVQRKRGCQRGGVCGRV